MTSYLPNLAHDNLSYYLIPAAWVVAIMPRFYAASTYQKATNKAMDTRAVRDFPKQVADDAGCDSKTKGRVIRAEAAQANGFENLGIFAAAVVAGNVGGLSPGMLNGLGLGYVVSRVVYNHIYIFNDVVPPAARTGAYFVGLGMMFAMFVQAGINTNKTLL